MPTTAQLRAEPWWDREIVTPELDWLGDELCRRTGRPRTAAGTKGNEAHLSGAHRSQEWISNSRYCTNRSYTVQSGLTAAQKRHIAGVDFTPGVWGSARNRQLMREQTGRLVAALKAGRLVGVREVIGTLDGRNVVGTRVDGSTFRSDSSHLDHWHLTLDRRYCGTRPLMERIVAVALGEDDDMSTEAEQQIKKIHDLLFTPQKEVLNGKSLAVGVTDLVYALILGKSEDTWTARKFAEQRLRDEAVLAAVQGDADKDEILARVDQRATELAQQHSAELTMLRAELAGQLGPALADAIREDLADLPADQLDAAMDRALRKVLGSLDSPSHG